MTGHESIQAMLALSAADALDPAERKRLAEHAQGCEICRRELAAWGFYARGLSALPQPATPLGLLERTRARVIEQREASIARRRENLLLAGLVVFGWIASLTMWMLVRIFAGGSFPIWGVDLANAVTWSLVSTLLAWMTAATAATMLGKHRESGGQFGRIL